MSFTPNPSLAANPATRGERSHGLGRRPSRADRTPIDEAAIRAWTAANARARAEYARCPNWTSRWSV